MRASETILLKNELLNISCPIIGNLTVKETVNIFRYKREVDLHARLCKYVQPSISLFEWNDTINNVRIIRQDSFI